MPEHSHDEANTIIAKHFENWENLAVRFPTNEKVKLTIKVDAVRDVIKLEQEGKLCHECSTKWLKEIIGCWTV